MPLKDPEARKAYHRKYISDRYHNDPEYRAAHKLNVKKVTKNHRETLKVLLEEFRKEGCSICGEMEPCTLDNHHRNPEEKEFTFGYAEAKMVSIARFKEELTKCDCVCKNCHAKIHAGVISVAGCK